MRRLTIILLVILSWLGVSADCRPETWFHVIGGNVSKAGITADLEAVREGGFGGIHFFHGSGELWDGVSSPVSCLNPTWEDFVHHTARECQRLGLSFRMQNCPGWSMSGGPWIKPAEAMRKLVCVRRFTLGGRVREIELPIQFRDLDSDWQDVSYLAYPTPIGESESPLVPVAITTNGNVRVFTFSKPVIVRTVCLPAPRELVGDWCYNPDVLCRIEARDGNDWRFLREIVYPMGCWQDATPLSVACAEFSSREFRVALTSSHPIRQCAISFRADAFSDNWEGKSGLTLRGMLAGEAPERDHAAYVLKSAVRRVRVGDVLPNDQWTLLRLGHVNMKLTNHPAPPEATGWECDKLDPRGVEANFSAYVGYLSRGALRDGLLKGMIVDSWECLRQTWTWKIEEYFEKFNGYSPRIMLPTLFGTVISSQEETDRFLLDWRRTIGRLTSENYYGRMSELAHAAGLDVAYETALGDATIGDPLEYWKYCDTPMCEYWRSPRTDEAGVGHPNFKPVRPCVSAAHLYGKRRISAESFTDMQLDWDESLRELKARAVAHFARGVTHTVTHTYTHNPQVDFKPPGTSFGTTIGTPFVRGQTWWSFMPDFTKWLADCCEFLERGHAVVDVLRYLGDDVAPRPDELEYFPDGYKCDFLNQDVLYNRLEVRGGRFVLPDGMSYSRLWVPEGAFLLPKTRDRLSALSNKGGTVVYGHADEATKGIVPQLVVKEGATGEVLWYHRQDNGTDCYFLAAATNGFQGRVVLRTQEGMCDVELALAPSETRFATIEKGGIVRGLPDTCGWSMASVVNGFELAFPDGWGAPVEPIVLDDLVPWKDMIGLSEEGRAFSGTATYTTTLHISEGLPGTCLDLGRVRDCARVFINGSHVADLWAEPYRCDIGKYVHVGDNTLRVEVTSSWFNRLAYDLQRPASRRKTWTIWKAVRAEAPRESGLIGPVRLFCRRTPQYREATR